MLCTNGQLLPSSSSLLLSPVNVHVTSPYTLSVQKTGSLVGRMSSSSPLAPAAADSWQHALQEEQCPYRPPVAYMGFFAETCLGQSRVFSLSISLILSYIVPSYREEGSPLIRLTALLNWDEILLNLEEGSKLQLRACALTVLQALHLLRSTSAERQFTPRCMMLA